MVVSDNVVYKVYYLGLEVLKTRNKGEALETADFYAAINDVMLETITRTKDGKVHEFYLIKNFNSREIALARIF